MMFDSFNFPAIPPNFYGNYHTTNLPLHPQAAHMPLSVKQIAQSMISPCHLKSFSHSMLADSFATLDLFKVEICSDKLKSFLATKLFPDSGSSSGSAVVGVFDEFLDKWSSILERFRILFHAYWIKMQDEKCNLYVIHLRDLVGYEESFVRSLFTLFMDGLLEELGGSMICVNACPMDIAIPYAMKKRANNDIIVETFTDHTDLMLFQKDIDHCVELCSSLIELTPPMGAMFGTRAKDCLDKLLGKVMCVIDMKSKVDSLEATAASTDLSGSLEVANNFDNNITVPDISPTVDPTVGTLGAMTDMFSLSILLQLSDNKKSYLTTHVIEPKEYILHLLLLCIPTTAEEVEFLLTTQQIIPNGEDVEVFKNVNQLRSTANIHNIGMKYPDDNWILHMEDDYDDDANYEFIESKFRENLHLKAKGTAKFFQLNPEDIEFLTLTDLSRCLSPYYD